MIEVSEASLVIARPGRPTRAGVRSDRRINFRVTDAEYEALKQMAAENRQPMTAAVREAINTYVADYSEARIFRSRKPPFE